MKIKTASGLIKLYMRMFNFQGWASLWGSIYIYPGYEWDEILIRHERQHLLQMERDGKVKFMLLYMWYMVRYGYQANPYEIEARMNSATGV